MGDVGTDVDVGTDGDAANSDEDASIAVEGGGDGDDGDTALPLLTDSLRSGINQYRSNMLLINETSPSTTFCKLANLNLDE